MLTGLLLRPPSSPTSSPFPKGVFAFASKLASLFLPRIRAVVSSPSSGIVVVVVVVAACRDPSSLVKYVAIGVAYPLPLASFFFFFPLLLLLLFDAFVLPLFVPFVFFVVVVSLDFDFTVFFFFFFSVDGVVNNKTSSPSSSNATFSKSNVFRITADDGVKTLPLFKASRSERSDPLEELMLISFPIERRLYLRFFVVAFVVVKAPEDELFVVLLLLCCLCCLCCLVVVVVIPSGERMRREMNRCVRRKSPNFGGEPTKKEERRRALI